MIPGSRIEGGTQILSSRVRNTIQSIKEIVGNHSDADIYVALKETNMDPNETTQKLLNQDPFHEVRRKRDKKKENAGYKGSTDPRKYNDHEDQGMKFNTYSDRNVRRGNSRNGILVAGISREFRVVRDNRMTQNANREMKPASPQYSTFTDKQVFSHISEKGSRGTYSNQKLSGKSDSSQALDGPSINTRKETSEERRGPAPSAISQGQPLKLNDSQSHSVAPASNNSVVGVYSSSSDPVHVPSDSRSAASVGAIKREIGVVGVRRKTSENSVKYLSQSGSFPNSQLGRDRPSSRESFRPFSAISKNDQPSQSSLPESIIPSMNVGRSFLSSQNQYNSRPNQQLVGHQKVTQANKEWKPKSTQKSSVNGPEVIDMPSKFVPPPQVDNNRDLETETAQLQDKPSRGTIFENQNVIIAEHIRVNETDRSRLTFGSFGPEFDTSGDSLSGSQAFGTSEESSAKPSTSARLLASSPESSSDETSGNKHVDSPDGQVQNSGSISPASDSVSEHQPPYKTESSSPPSLDNFADIGLVQDHNPSYTPSDSQELDIPELPSFSTYDPQTGYDIPYFRPGMDEGVKGQGSPFAQESLRSQTTNIPGSTIAMVQQQQPPMAQMYPQVHVSHFANLMPYRHYLSPVYVPPMPMPGYSNNHPSYPHPPNGSSYLLMPGGGSHLSASNHKYGIQQFKPVPNGSPTGFGNFHSPTGYAINAPGVVSSATGIEDSSRLKYKDVNLYVPNQQAEASEIWYQNPRDLPGMQSTASYYNMPTQTPHATYLPSHTSHASFNAAAAAQSSHIQYQGLYHHAQPQPSPIASPHHMGPAMGGGNVGVGVAAVAPGSQVGPYQQPQLGHLNWTPSF